MTRIPSDPSTYRKISTHTSLAGRDEAIKAVNDSAKFLLTRPSRDVTKMSPASSSIWSFLLTRPSRDVTYYPAGDVKNVNISTHTSLAGRDPATAKEFSEYEYISTHTSLAGRDEICESDYIRYTISTHTSLAGRDEFLENQTKTA